jgi:ribosomal-protein-serine acetyltransferase
MVDFTLRVDEQTELRLPKEGDAEEELALWRENHEEYLWWFPGDYESKTLEKTREWIRSNLERFSNNRGFAVGIWHRGDLAGMIDLQEIDWVNMKSGLAYWLGAAFQGKGLMTMACRALVDHAFGDMKLNRIEIRCAPENTKSCAVAQRLGFKREGVLRQSELLRGRYLDHVVYAVLREDNGREDV